MPVFVGCQFENLEDAPCGVTHVMRIGAKGRAHSAPNQARNTSLMDEFVQFAIRSPPIKTPLL